MSNLGRPGKPRGELGPVRFKTVLVPGTKKTILSVTAAVAVVDPDGVSRSVKRTRATQADAKTAVTAAAKARVFSTSAHRGIDANTSIGALVDLYLTDLQRDVKLLPQSKERYRQAAMGIRKTWPALPVSELDAGTVVVHLEQLEETSPSGARLCRTVLRKVLRAALRANAVTSNVAWRADVALSVPRKNPRALTTAEIRLLHVLIERWVARQATTGPRRTNDLVEIIDVMLATGCRISEALALRRSDVYLDGSEVFVDLTGTIVYSKGVGSYRQEKTKNGTTAEHVHLTSAAATAVRRRALDSEHELLFSTRKGGAMQQQNISKQLRQVVAGTELEWLTSHVFRKTSGTAVYRAKGIDAAQKHLRHRDRATTEGVYVEKATQAEDHTDVLEQLANNPE